TVSLLAALFRRHAAFDLVPGGGQLALPPSLLVDAAVVAKTALVSVIQFGFWQSGFAHAGFYPGGEVRICSAGKRANSSRSGGHQRQSTRSRPTTRGPVQRQQTGVCLCHLVRRNPADADARCVWTASAGEDFPR